MLIALHLILYVLVVLVTLGLLAASSARDGLRPYRRGILFGLLASPSGFVLPYLAFLGIVALCHDESGGHWPTDGLPVIDPIARIAVPALLFIGPIIGPPLIIVFVALRCRQS